MRTTRVPIVAFALLVLVGAARADQSVPPTVHAAEPKWPARLDYARLPPVGSTERAHHSYHIGPPPIALASPAVDQRSYQQEGPDGHGLTTTVYFLRGARVFYLYSDCIAGHADGYLGPFRGDPRIVLAPTS